MEINAKLTLLFSDEGLRIEIRDDDACVTFFRGKLSTEQACQAMGRLSNTPMEGAEVFGLELVGRKHESETFSFSLPEGTSYDDEKRVAIEVVKELCPNGWKPDLYFNSQNSFTRSGKSVTARTIIRRWVEKEIIEKFEEVK